jgi:hypothetical protein
MEVFGTSREYREMRDKMLVVAEEIKAARNC